uniref:Lebercilin LCA5 n=1 Tax=Chelonoidis abingdonii TaxID=106734 RepID=A0A8C0GIM5_CHEAB
MGERTRSLDSDHDRTSDGGKNSNSYYSDEDNASHASDQSLTLSSQSTSHGKKDHKTETLRSLVHYQTAKKPVSKYAPAKRGRRWGFRSQSLSKDSPAKDIDLVTKRVLSARLLKINELRNELTELHIKLDELQKENRALTRLQYRQEKALNKFEDTENEISQLLARHNNEIRILRERLRKSQERERTTERRLKDSEDELYRTKNSLQKLKKLSEDKHLAERDELAKKLASAENRLDESEKRIKDLEKSLELSNSSFQRQLQSEKKKVHEAQEENKALQEELQQLNQKLKEKERELDAKNIYANRMLKPSPKKEVDVTQRKKASSQNTKKGIQTTKGVQTSGYFSPIEFPPPSEFFSVYVTDQKEEETLLRTVSYCIVPNNPLKKLNFLRRKKENNFLLVKEEEAGIESEIYKIENEIYNTEKLEEDRQKKDLLLAKMCKIDRETQSTISMKLASKAHLTDTASKSDSLEKNEKTYQFLETTEKLFNGFPVYDSHDVVIKAEGQKRQNVRTTDSSNDLTFGSYVPSFGKGSGRPSWLNQKSIVLEENTKENTDFNTKKEKKSNLMEQLFGTSANTIAPPKSSDSSALETDYDSGSALPPGKSNKVKVKDDDFFFSEGRNFNPNRHRLQHTTSRTAVKAVDSFEDEIEEVIL